MRWLVLLTLVTSLLGWWQKSPCRVHAWEDQYQYTRGCYTDVFALYFAERLDEGRTPYAEHPVEYPVVIGGVMQVAATAVTVFPADERPRRFYDVTWALLTACALVVVVTTARLAGRRRPWDAAMFAAAPLLVLHGSTNWDLVAMALAGLGLLSWARARPLAAGVLLGAATATKLYPVLLLVPLGALCLRAGRLRPWAVAAAAAVVTPVLLSAPVYLTSPMFAEVAGVQTVVAGSPVDRLTDEGLAALLPTVEATTADGVPVVGINAAYRFFELNTERPADWDSLWYALQEARGGVPLDSSAGTPRLLNLAVAVAFLTALGGIVLLGLRAPRRPRVMPMLFLTVLAFLLTNKVWSPQFSLWLLPLALLARPRWGPLLAWQAAEGLVLLTRFYFFISNSAPGKGISGSWFLSAVVLRDVVLLGVAALVVRDVLRPELDVVRRDGVDDPAGGVLDGAPDRPAAHPVAGATGPDPEPVPDAAAAGPAP
ncbi:MAG: Putative transmembrane protein [uncultured Frankineae bacterium]|uniref:Transmembrane protein n=1 Tax=uncultured Frankineae bacterium TaxID=437475 RepID=A0A6J4LUQ8_9ACTN|nr:MAG: Putative transmembrane protein [uncultured Frankineae bacterium]